MQQKWIVAGTLGLALAAAVHAQNREPASPDQEPPSLPSGVDPRPMEPQGSGIAPARPGGGPSVDINTATVESLRADLGLSEDEAAAVIRYRRKHGPLESESQLRSIPGLKSGSLERYKGRLIFSSDKEPGTSGSLPPQRGAVAVQAV